MIRPTLYAPNAFDPAREMLEKFIDSRLAEGATFEIDQLIQCSWMWFKVGGDEKKRIILAPELGIMPMNFVSDCSDALNLILLQRYICDSFGVKCNWCDARQSVIVIKDIDNCKKIFMNRDESDADHASGWFFGAEDSKMDAQNVEHLELRSVWEVACQVPMSIEFFLLPSGWQVVFSDNPTVLKGYKPILPQSGSYYEKKYGC